MVVPQRGNAVEEGLRPQGPGLGLVVPAGEWLEVRPDEGPGRVGRVEVVGGVQAGHPQLGGHAQRVRPEAEEVLEVDDVRPLALEEGAQGREALLFRGGGVSLEPRDAVALADLPPLRAPGEALEVARREHLHGAALGGREGASQRTGVVLDAVVPLGRERMDHESDAHGLQVRKAPDAGSTRAVPVTIGRSPGHAAAPASPHPTNGTAAGSGALRWDCPSRWEPAGRPPQSTRAAPGGAARAHGDPGGVSPPAPPASARSRSRPCSRSPPP